MDFDLLDAAGSPGDIHRPDCPAPCRLAEVTLFSNCNGTNSFGGIAS
jgi:hypothetical protein